MICRSLMQMKFVNALFYSDSKTEETEELKICQNDRKRDGRC